MNNNKLSKLITRNKMYRLIFESDYNCISNNAIVQKYPRTFSSIFTFCNYNNRFVVCDSYIQKGKVNHVYYKNYNNMKFRNIKNNDTNIKLSEIKCTYLSLRSCIRKRYVNWEEY